MVCMPQCMKAARRWDNMKKMINHENNNKNTKVRVIIERWLFNVIMIALMVSLVGMIIVQRYYQKVHSYKLIEAHVNDVGQDVDDSFKYLLYDWTKSFTAELEKMYADIDNEYLRKLVEFNSSMISELNIIDDKGIIVYSSVPEYLGWDMNSGEQGKEFMCLLNGEEYYEQKLCLNDYGDGVEMVYAGRAFSSREGFVEIGVSRENYENYINETLSESVKNRRIGSTGYIVILGKDNKIVASTDNRYDGEKINIPEILTEEEGQIIHSTCEMFGKKCYAVSTLRNAYYILGVLPVYEAGFFGDLDKILILIMNGIILFCIFRVLSKMLNKYVVRGIEDINDSLGKITEGDLDERAKVTTSLEFSQLSDGINHTVTRLKEMMEETEARMEAELEMARNIQQTSLPSCTGFFRHNKNFELWACMETAKMVGGDFYDFYMLPGDILAVTIADVSDKGIPAAMFMMRAKTLLKSLAEEGLSVEDMVTAANKGLWEDNEGSMFVTAWIGFIDLKTGTVRYVHAGHTCPVLLKNSEPVFIKEKRQLLIGGMPDVTYQGQEFVMKPQDTLFLYTDGVTEAEGENGEQYGNNRLLSIFSGMDEAFRESTETEFCTFACKRVIEDVRSYSGDNPQFDDITVLCVKYTGNDGSAPKGERG